MSKRVLIVNRGEIAIRVAKALNELGFISVGVWTDNEVDPPHLEFCQEWVHLEGSSNKETYLNTSKILDLIKKYNIDAVHPGYGFLSENADFAAALEKNGTIFIGPHAQAIRMMGDKAISKSVAQKAKVPVVPGSVGEVKNEEEALKIAQEVGFPVLLKAVAGGGGKGMRPCHNEQEIKQYFNIVKREALSSFGHDGLLVEKYIQNPHHIEVQVLGNKRGDIYHLYERECSIQRRHQKIIEEAPSPFIGKNEKLREKICSTAVELARAVNYDSAGTVEFIMGENGDFYFLEMNTRIQVEHPITEEITGIDLVVNMIKAAFGMDLDIKSQDDIKLRGHAIELRICAEDPVTMLPAPGKVLNYSTQFPQGIRFDHCIYKNYEVTPDFDPMIGKLIALGINREVCLRKIRSAINGLTIEGLKTNISLHRVIVDESNFINGNYSTHYLKEILPENKISQDIEKDLFLRVLSFELSQGVN